MKSCVFCRLVLHINLKRNMQVKSQQVSLWTLSHTHRYTWALWTKMSDRYQFHVFYFIIVLNPNHGGHGHFPVSMETWGMGGGAYQARSHDQNFIEKVHLLFCTREPGVVLVGAGVRKRLPFLSALRRICEEKKKWHRKEYHIIKYICRDHRSPAGEDSAIKLLIVCF